MDGEKPKRTKKLTIEERNRQITKNSKLRDEEAKKENAFSYIEQIIEIQGKENVRKHCGYIKLWARPYIEEYFQKLPKSKTLRL